MCLKRRQQSGYWRARTVFGWTGLIKLASKAIHDVRQRIVTAIPPNTCVPFLKSTLVFYFSFNNTSEIFLAKICAIDGTRA
jgi:hypothetical protein